MSGGGLAVISAKRQSAATAGPRMARSPSVHQVSLVGPIGVSVCTSMSRELACGGYCCGDREHHIKKLDLYGNTLLVFWCFVHIAIWLLNRSSWPCFLSIMLGLPIKFLLQLANNNADDRTRNYLLERTMPIYLHVVIDVVCMICLSFHSTTIPEIELALLALQATHMTLLLRVALVHSVI